MVLVWYSLRILLLICGTENSSFTCSFYYRVCERKIFYGAEELLWCGGNLGDILMAKKNFMPSIFRFQAILQRKE